MMQHTKRGSARPGWLHVGNDYGDERLRLIQDPAEPRPRGLPPARRAASLARG